MDLTTTRKTDPKQENVFNTHHLSPSVRTHCGAYCGSPLPNSSQQLRFVEYRGFQLTAFEVKYRGLLLCLPQAYEVFLKHLVGGLHTIYTKLKRLHICPVVCNVEQVRILRGLGAIQPGVNRCKLIGPEEFDLLYADCTSSGQV